MRSQAALRDVARRRWETDRIELDEFIDAGERVLRRSRVLAERGRRARRRQLEVPSSGPCETARSCGLTYFTNRAEALEAVGPVGARRSRRLLSLRDTARAMSQENVEIVRRGCEVVIEGLDQGNPTAVFDEGLVAPTYTLIRARGKRWVPRTYVGREAIMREWLAQSGPRISWTGRSEPVTIIDAGDDRVVTVAAPGRQGQGKRRCRRGPVRAPSSTLKAARSIEQRELHRPRRSPRSRGAVGARRSRRLLSLRDTARAMSQENVEIVRAVYRRLQPRGLGRRAQGCCIRTSSSTARERSDLCAASSSSIRCAASWTSFVGAVGNHSTSSARRVRRSRRRRGSDLGSQLRTRGRDGIEVTVAPLLRVDDP